MRRDNYRYGAGRWAGLRSRYVSSYLCRQCVQKRVQERRDDQAENANIDKEHQDEKSELFEHVQNRLSALRQEGRKDLTSVERWKGQQIEHKKRKIQDHHVPDEYGERV